MFVYVLCLCLSLSLSLPHFLSLRASFISFRSHSRPQRLLSARLEHLLLAAVFLRPMNVAEFESLFIGLYSQAILQALMRVVRNQSAREHEGFLLLFSPSLSCGSPSPLFPFLD